MASTSDWEVFCREVIDQPQLLTDSRFQDAPARRVNRGVLEGIVEAAFQQHDAAYWLERLKAVDRATLVAFYIRGQSLKQMSRDFETPVGTIKRRLHVARNRLKKQMERASADPAEAVTSEEPRPKRRKRKLACV